MTPAPTCAEGGGSDFLEPGPQKATAADEEEEDADRLALSDSHSDVLGSSFIKAATEDDPFGTRCFVEDENDPSDLELRCLLHDALSSLYASGDESSQPAPNTQLEAAMEAVARTMSPLSSMHYCSEGGIGLSLGLLRVNLGLHTPSWNSSPVISAAASPRNASTAPVQATELAEPEVPLPPADELVSAVWSGAPASTVMSMNSTLIGDSLAMAFGGSDAGSLPAFVDPGFGSRNLLEDQSDNASNVLLAGSGGETARTDSMYGFNESGASSRAGFGVQGLLGWTLDGSPLQLDMQQLLSMGFPEQPAVPRLSELEVRALPQLQFQGREEDARTCSICLEVVRPAEVLSSLPCSHEFHTECLVKWLTRAALCPNCRAVVEPENDGGDGTVQDDGLTEMISELDGL